MSIKKFEVLRSKQTLHVFMYDPQDEFNNVIKKERDGQFVAAYGAFLNKDGRTVSKFIEPGDKVAIQPEIEIPEGQNPTLVLLPEDYEKFLEGWEVIESKTTHNEEL